MTGPLAVETRRCQATRARGSSARRIHGGPPRWRTAGFPQTYECGSLQPRELRRCTNAEFPRLGSGAVVRRIEGRDLQAAARRKTGHSTAAKSDKSTVGAQRQQGFDCDCPPPLQFCQLALRWEPDRPSAVGLLPPSQAIEVRLDDIVSEKPARQAVGCGRVCERRELTGLGRIELDQSLLEDRPAHPFEGGFGPIAAGHVLEKCEDTDHVVLLESLTRFDLAPAERGGRVEPWVVHSVFVKQAGDRGRRVHRGGRVLARLPPRCPRKIPDRR